MTKPTEATIKKLFAVSGNKCAFPKCTQSLIDNNSENVIGQICHIKAKNKGGPRYDPKQTDEERHEFNNLILMCPNHHSIIDSDVDSYTVQRLIQIKAEHEQCYINGVEPSDKIVRQFIANLTSPTVTDGSIILSQNQMGGQIAHSITNIGSCPRQISQTAVNNLITELKKYPPEQVKIVSSNDTEPYNLAIKINEILKYAGWETKGVSPALLFPPVENIIIEAPKESEALLRLLNWCNDVGLKPQGNLNPKLLTTQITVGTNV